MGNNSKKIQLKSKKSVRLYDKDFKSFQAFAAGAAIGSMILWQIRKRRNRGRIKSRSHLHLSPRPSCSHTGFSNGLIARMLQISKSKACRLKNKAVSCGYLTVIKKYENLHTYQYIKKFLSNSVDDLVGGPVRFIGKKYVKQLYDEIIPNLNFKRKKIFMEKNGTI